jgi:hypothetical protein
LATKQKTNFLPLMTLIQLVDADKPGSQKDWRESTRMNTILPSQIIDKTTPRFLRVSKVLLYQRSSAQISGKKLYRAGAV